MDDAAPAPHGARNGPATPAATPAATPVRPAASAGPHSARRSIHTPLGQSAPRDAFNSIRNGTPASGRKANAPTPHAKAARRALDQRRLAMFTPGKNRRRSLKQQRETPMGILRSLGRALAPASRPIASSSSSPRGSPPSAVPLQEDDEDDEDDELPIDRPRLSLPLDDDDDPDLQPPRSSGLEEENYTVQSIELPRRAVSEQPSRYSRGSFGSVRGSDFFPNHDPIADLGRQSDFFPGLLEDLQAQEAAGFTYERIDADPTRRTAMGARESDFGLEMPAGLDDQTTFMLSEPGADVTQISLAGPSAVESTGNEAREPLGDDDVVVSDVGFGGFPDVGAQDGGEDEGMNLTEADAEPSTKGSKARKRRNRISKHGIEYPQLPSAFVKRVAQTALQSSGLSNKRIAVDTLAALADASDWFFEQLGDDLGAYASHAKRRTIEESDVVTLMQRQRQTSAGSTLFSLAERHLPRELLQNLRMPPAQPTKQRRAKRRREEDEQDAMEAS